MSNPENKEAVQDQSAIQPDDPSKAEKEELEWLSKELSRLDGHQKKLDLSSEKVTQEEQAVLIKAKRELSGLTEQVNTAYADEIKKINKYLSEHHITEKTDHDQEQAPGLIDEKKQAENKKLAWLSKELEKQNEIPLDLASSHLTNDEREALIKNADTLHDILEQFDKKYDHQIKKIQAYLTERQLAERISGKPYQPTQQQVRAGIAAFYAYQRAVRQKKKENKLSANQKPARKRLGRTYHVPAPKKGRPTRGKGRERERVPDR